MSHATTFAAALVAALTLTLPALPATAANPAAAAESAQAAQEAPTYQLHVGGMT